MRDVPTGLDQTPPYEGSPVGERVVTPQYTGEDVRKGLTEHASFRRWRDLPPEERDRMSVFTCVVQMWNAHGKVPSVERIVGYKKLPEHRVRAALDHPQTIADLIAIGVIPDDALTWSDVANEARAGLTTKQVAAVREYFARTDPDDKRTLAQALADAGVTPTQWNGWLEDPVFAGYLSDVGERIYGRHKTDIDVALVREASAGNVPALRLAMEVTGRIKQDRGAVDTNMLLARVQEALVRHCTPEQALAIANELLATVGALRANTATPVVIDSAGRELT